MCMRAPSVPAPPPPPQLPPERAAQMAPDGNAIRTATERRTTERAGMRPAGSGNGARRSTILTSPQGVLAEAETERKTLLGA